MFCDYYFYHTYHQAHHMCYGLMVLIVMSILHFLDANKTSIHVDVVLKGLCAILPAVHVNEDLLKVILFVLYNALILVEC